MINWLARVWFYVQMLLLAIAIGVVLALLLGPWRLAGGSGDDEVLELADAIQILQPVTSNETARRWARVYRAAGEETWIDPRLLIAISMRESSLLEASERGEALGALGERGLMQVHGVALEWRPADCELPLTGARCQVHTGARVLQYWRTACPGSRDRWVSAYGRGACPSEREARTERGVRLARYYYRAIGGEWR